MSDDLIRRAREALVSVTPGPWSYNSMGEFGPAYDDDYQAFGMICDPVGECDWPNAVDNARFIAAARDLVPALADRLEAQEALLREAMEVLGKLHHAVCGETGFAQCVRDHSKTIYPWPALDVADHAARATLAKLRAHLDGRADEGGVPNGI